MAERRRGLGRGLGALIPPVEPGSPRPVDVFFPDPVPGQRPAGAGPGEPGSALEPGEGGGGTVIDVRTERPAAPRRPRTPGRSGDEAPAADAVPGQEELGGLLPVPGVEFREVPVDAVVPNPRQPRRSFDDDAMAELVHSIGEIGVLHPCGGRPVPGAAGAPRSARVRGARRGRARAAAGLEQVPAIVRQTRDDDLLRDALLENLHRSDLNPLEEAAAYQQLLDDFGCTHDQLAQRIGRSRPQISNTIRLLRLPPLVQRRVAAGVLSAGHARALLGLPDGAAMERLAQRVVAEGLSVRATEEAVALGGDAAPAPARTRAAAARPAGLDDLVGRLCDRLDTRVSVAMGQHRGRLVVEFAGVDDLNRIIASLAPGDPGVAGAAGEG